MTIQQLIEKLQAIDDKEQQVFISIMDGLNEIQGEINGMYRTALKSEFTATATAIVLTTINNPSSI